MGLCLSDTLGFQGILLTVVFGFSQDEIIIFGLGGGEVVEVVVDDVGVGIGDSGAVLADGNGLLVGVAIVVSGDFDGVGGNDVGALLIDGGTDGIDKGVDGESVGWGCDG